MLTVSLARSAFVVGSTLLGDETGSALASKVFNDIWPQVLYSSMFRTLSEVGQYIAAFALVFLLLQWIIQLQNGGFPGNLRVFVGPILAFILLANQGLLLSQMSLTAREGVNQLTAYILSQSSKDGNFNQAERLAMKDLELKLSYSIAMQDCVEHPFDSTEVCQKRVISELLSGPDERYLLERVYDRVADRIFEGVGGAVEIVLAPILLVMHFCFAWSLEVLTLLNFLFLPLFLGISILPTGVQVLLTWVKNFFSLFLMKLAFVLITGLSAAAAVAAKDLITIMVLPIVLGLLGPILAVYIGVGGLPLFAQVATSAVAYPLVRNAPRLAQGSINRLRRSGGGGHSGNSPLHQSLRFMPQAMARHYRTRPRP